MEGKNGQPLTGIQKFPSDEATRLVDILKVAKYVKEPEPVKLPEPEKVENNGTETKQDIVTGEEPVMSWKREEIVSFLQKNKIPFEESAEKKGLLKFYSDWKDSKK